MLVNFCWSIHLDRVENWGSDPLQTQFTGLIAAKDIECAAMPKGFTRGVDLDFLAWLHPHFFCCLGHTWISYRIEVQGSGVQTNCPPAIGSMTFGVFSLIHCLTSIQSHTNIVCMKSGLILIATLKGSKERKILLQIDTSSTLISL